MDKVHGPCTTAVGIYCHASRRGTHLVRLRDSLFGVHMHCSRHIRRCHWSCWTKTT